MSQLWLPEDQVKNNMNILAIDYGEKKIGLAWMQTGIDVVLPYGKIENIDLALAIGQVVELIEDENVDKVVVGLPIGLDGEENENTKRVRDFARELKSKIDIKIDFVDERFSSRQADSTPGDVSRDEKAAMIILQSYIDSN